MRIVVNNIAASSRGAISSLKEFYTYVKNYDTENEWIFLLGDTYVEETDRIKVITLPRVKKSKLYKLVFDFITGRKFVDSLNPDVIISMQNIITFGVKAPQVAYIQQLLPFQDIYNFSFFKKAERSLAVQQKLIGKVIALSAKKADKVIVQTNHMKEKLIEKTKISPDKVLCCTPNIEAIDEYIEEGVFDKTQFFSPTSDDFYKNNVCIYEAVKQLRSEGIDAFNVQITIDKNVTMDNIFFSGKIPREEVFKKYNRTTMIFPTFIEALGYPFTEARQIGTICLVSDIGVARELLAGYENAYFFDPFKPSELAELMKKVLRGEIVKKPVKKEKKDDVNSWDEVIRILREM